MQRFNQSTAQCHIFTYKEGLLSPLAHDLRIVVTSFEVELGGEDHFINAHFDANSLRVDCAMLDGAARPDLLSSSDKADIQEKMLNDVLAAEAFPEIVIVSSALERKDSSYRVEGVLALHGTTRKIYFAVRREGDNLTAECTLHLPDFGIRPFTALFGAVRIKPDILIRISLPADGIENIPPA